MTIFHVAQFVREFRGWTRYQWPAAYSAIFSAIAESRKAEGIEMVGVYNCDLFSVGGSLAIGLNFCSVRNGLL